MAHALYDRVLETSTTTGTGDITLAAAVTGFRRFSDVFSTNDTTTYFIEAVDGSGVPTGEWESGIGTYSAANTLTRTTVLASSNAGAAVSLSAGTKRVGVGAVAAAGVFSPVLIETLSTTSGTSVTSAVIPQRFNILLVQFNGVSHSNGSSTTMGYGISNDGSTFSTNIACTVSTSNSVTWYGGGIIPKYTSDDGVLSMGASNLGSSPGTGTGPVTHAWLCTGGIKYLRFSMTAGNFDAGSINIYGI